LEYVLAVASLVLFLLHAALAILDFPLALVSSLVVLPSMLVARPPPASNRRVASWRTLLWLLAVAWLVITSPPALFELAKMLNLNPDFWLGDTVLDRLAYASQNYGLIHLVLYSLVLFPAQLAQIGVVSGLFGTHSSLRMFHLRLVALLKPTWMLSNLMPKLLFIVSLVFLILALFFF